MNRVTRGTVVLAAALAALSCKGDPTDSLRNGVDKLVANPSAIFLRPDSTKGIIVEALDEQGNRLATDFKIAANPTGATLVEDTAYNIVYDVNGNAKRPSPWTRARYEVTATSQFGSTSFTINAGGKSLVIPVRVLPDTATSVTLSTTTPNVGDTVTATAGAGFLFSSTTTVGVSGANVATLDLSADSTQVTFVVGPGASGVPSFTNLVVAYATSIGGYAANGSAALTTPAAANLTANLTNAAAGDTIVVTAPAPYKFTPSSTPSVGSAGLALVGVSTDSTTLSFLIGPSAGDTISVDNLVVSGVPTAGTYTLTTATTLTTPAVPNFPATYSSAAPALNDTITMTVGSGFRLLPTAVVTINGRPATIISRAPDSLSLTMVPVPGTGAGAPTVNGIVLSFLTGVSLNIPANANVTAPAGLAGTDAFATAPTIPLPGAGQTVIFHDAGSFANVAECTGDLGGPCRVYKVVVPTARTYALTLSWQGTTDLGIYTYDNTQSLDTGLWVCDAKGAGSAGQPETGGGCTASMTAGTYYIVVDSFSPFYGAPNNVDPTDIRLTIVGS